jgi:hypothetical protein
VIAVTSVRSDAIPVSCHINKTTPHSVAMGTKPTIQIRTDRTRVRPYLLRDRIHDKGLDLETFLAGGVP